MTGKGKRERVALDRLADVLVDDILSTSDEDILAEFKEAGCDPNQNAAEMRALFEKSVLASNKKRLAVAKAAATANRRSPTASVAMPIDMAAARARLRAVVDRPGLPQKVTLAARKENELSDADILGMLEDLLELGILPPDDSQDGKP
ncbi:hypothetical protein N183_27145 [Sinorhizobium sp. Sb3]|uniref:hypothetical protein n=1 Tax=Sinorhizobium sp. Sb3 TaxID=1358417 RepID=UPI00071D1ECA|nr:hypothetical protein [Sinorhizobium sp. Sb3]KSV72248.1 hypothetical protein N183_27145 [Sinorhizobium sp. Sb3]